MPRLLTPTRVADFRSRLCDVAMQLLAEVGYDRFNMRELAARLGVSAMTAYRYFKDKDEILANIRVRAIDRLGDRIESCAAMSGTAAARCAAVCHAYVEFGCREPTYYRLMFEVPKRSAALSPDLLRAEARVLAALTAYLHPVENGVDLELFGRALWSTLHGIVALHLNEKLSDVEVDRVLAETLRLMSSAHGELAGADAFLQPAGKWADSVARHQGSPMREGMIALSA